MNRSSQSIWVENRIQCLAITNHQQRQSTQLSTQSPPQVVVCAEQANWDSLTSSHLSCMSTINDLSKQQAQKRSQNCGMCHIYYNIQQFSSSLSSQRSPHLVTQVIDSAETINQNSQIISYIPNANLLNIFKSYWNDTGGSVQHIRLKVQPVVSIFTNIF